MEQMDLYVLGLAKVLERASADLFELAEKETDEEMEGRLIDLVGECLWTLACAKDLHTYMERNGR